jgi:soluble lytic murein transglycosylase-like protein
MDYQNCPYDHLFRQYAQAAGLPWKLIKAQAFIESGFNPNAVSPCGAKGLMQMMPATALAIVGPTDAGDPVFDPEENVKAGIAYDRNQFDHYTEIPDICERLKFSLAAYNGGRGYINVALGIARWKELGDSDIARARPGLWQTWAYTSRFLADPLCVVKGEHPDHKQITEYVEKIWAVFIPDIFEMKV